MQESFAEEFDAVACANAGTPVLLTGDPRYSDINQQCLLGISLTDNLAVQTQLIAHVVGRFISMTCSAGCFHSLVRVCAHVCTALWCKTCTSNQRCANFTLRSFMFR